jgi:hypothetical protein
MKKTFYETMWSILEKQGILQNWFDEGLLVTKKNTTFWTPKALEILGLEESIGGVNLSDQPGNKPREVEPTVKVNQALTDLCVKLAAKFSLKEIGVSGKGGNVKAIEKKMTGFKKEFDYTDQEILTAVDLYLADQKRTGNMRFVQEAHYFVSKMIDKVPVSNLAKWCEEVRNGNSGKRYTSHTVL